MNANIKLRNLNSISETPTVAVLLKHIHPVNEAVLCLKVLELFLNNVELFAVPIVNDDYVPVGIVDRHTFIDIFIKPYAKEIYAKKSISSFMNASSIIVDKETSIDDITKIIIDAGMQHMVSGFIATDNEKYIGIANGHDLLNEITQRKQAHLFLLAHYDHLTQLPNRLLFLDRLEMALHESCRNKTQVGILFIDVDNFKNFNDSMGHGFGDKILIATAMRLSNCARESDTVARLSGDEFTIMLEDDNCRENLRILCLRIIEAMKQPLNIMGREVFVTVSIGSAVCPIDDMEPTGLLAKADSAMYEAKRSGRNTFRQYVAGMSLYTIDRLSIETDLRKALDRKEFELFYQPQVCLLSGKVASNEALIRWRHPERGLLSPIHFIDIIEETGLIVPIGKWVLHEACRQHAAWVAKGLEPMCVSVNISAMQFYQADFSEMVRSVIADHGMDPSYLELELTESLFMFKMDSVLKTLSELHDFGIKIAIDDFGTGYSNLGYLKRFPIDKLKIDQSFIRHLESEPINVEIVRAIAALGKSMSMELVAEGVETEEELALVQSNGCEFVQGYRYSKPLPPDQLESWIRERELRISFQ
jgi:diguanylate cyclase (GGDEF)-like protein